MTRAVGDPVAEKACQREMAEVVGAHMRLESIDSPGERQTHHARVVHQDVNGFHRVGEFAHTGEIGQVEVSDLDVAAHLGSRLLGLPDGAARDDHAVTGGGQRRGGRFADAAVASGDDDPHRVIMPLPLDSGTSRVANLDGCETIRQCVSDCMRWASAPVLTAR
jgi:hypothetical protein